MKRNMEDENQDFLVRSNQSFINFLTVFNSLYMFKDSMTEDEIFEYMNKLIDIWSKSYTSHFYKMVDEMENSDKAKKESKEYIDKCLSIVVDDINESIENTLKVFK